MKICNVPESCCNTEISDIVMACFKFNESVYLSYAEKIGDKRFSCFGQILMNN